MIRLGFFGAAGEVTGSCYLVTTDQAKVLIDLGMHQGERLAHEHNQRLPPINLRHLDAVVLTHAHLDHSGRLPILVKHGYRRAIHSTPATADVAEIILRDSARLQTEECIRFNRRLRRHDEPPREPYYDEQDVERLLPQFTTTRYDRVISIAPGVTIKFVDSGHILGAASVQMTVQEGSRTVTIVFSGDIGPTGSPILRDPITPTPADAVVLESTYGDRDHRSLTETCDEFLAILKSAQAAGARVLIPAFAVGRAQDLVFHMGEFLRAGVLSGLRVFVDSPMARSVSELYARNKDVYDDRALQLLTEKMHPLSFPGLTYVRTVEESKRLNYSEGSMVIIAASGMCTGGRIMHHLLHGLSNPDTQVIIVGFQGRGTLGRRLVEGANSVSIFRSEVLVRAKIHTLGGFSAHAGQSGLLEWVAPLRPSQPKSFLTHGENIPRMVLCEKLKVRFDLHPEMPQYGEFVDL